MKPQEQDNSNTDNADKNNSNIDNTDEGNSNINSTDEDNSDNESMINSEKDKNVHNTNEDELNEQRDEIWLVLNEFKRLIEENSDKIPSYYLHENYFSRLTETLEAKEYNNINKMIGDKLIN